jgi:hypothetical protein
MNLHALTFEQILRVCASLEDPKSSSLTMPEGELFCPFPDGEIVLGLEQTSPVLFMAVKSC